MDILDRCGLPLNGVKLAGGGGGGVTLRYMEKVRCSFKSFEQRETKCADQLRGLFIFIHYFERVNTFSYTAILPCGPLVTKY